MENVYTAFETAWKNLIAVIECDKLDPAGYQTIIASQKQGDSHVEVARRKYKMRQKLADMSASDVFAMLHGRATTDCQTFLRNLATKGENLDLFDSYVLGTSTTPSASPVKLVEKLAKGRSADDLDTLIAQLEELKRAKLGQ